MYLKNTLILNSGPLENLEIKFQFKENGDPKPTIIVGKNGTGKSNLLAFVTDALIEIAARQFNDVAPMGNGVNHKWHRVIGSTTIRCGCEYELAILEFEDQADKFTYLSKGGILPKSNINSRLVEFGEVPNWDPKENTKKITGPDSRIEEIFRKGCYVSFPTGRSEIPYWFGTSQEADDAVFSDQFQSRLNKPIYVQSSIKDTKPWLVNIILDQSIDIFTILNDTGGFNKKLINAQINATALGNVNSIIGSILQNPESRLVRGGRELGARRLMVTDNQELLMPTMDSFSSGQAMLFGIFGTILRYADAGEKAQSTDQMKGIVLIDEADAHLHADLQHDVLPTLIKLFPKIQFIISAHSPFFPLGMEKNFGEENFSLIQMPDGSHVSAERFLEFESAYNYLTNTKRFEDNIKESIFKSNLPLVIVEGTIDIDYIKKAAQFLGKDKIINNIDLIDGDGFRGLDKIWKNLWHHKWNNISQIVILLYDCDVNPKNNEIGRAFQRTLPKFDSIIEKGIENLFPTETIYKVKSQKSAFIDHSPKSISTIRGEEIVTPEVWSVNKDEKRNLCDWLCKNGDARDFARFSHLFDILEEILPKN